MMRLGLFQRLGALLLTAICVAPSLALAGDPALSGPLQIRLWNITDRGEVVAGVPHEYDLYTRALRVYPDHKYAVFVYGGADADLTAGGITIAGSSVPKTACLNSGKSAVQTFISNPNYTVTNPDLTKETSFFKIDKVGAAHLYAVIVRYPPNKTDGTAINPDNRTEFCNLNTTQAPGFLINATALEIDVTRNYNCPTSGICITDVEPQTLTATQRTSRFKIKIRRREEDRRFGYAYMAGRYQANVVGGLDKGECEVLLNNAGARSAGPEIITVLPPRIDGNPATYAENITYTTPQYSVNFGSSTENRRIVAFLFRWTIDPDNPTAGAPRPDDYCDNIADSKGWLYDDGGGGGPTPGGNSPGGGGGGGGGGGTRLDTRGGFIARGLTIDDSTGSPGLLPSGICAPGSDITLLLANSQGSISLKAAGLMGLCTPNFVAQIIRLLMILAGFFFTFSVIYSGIALFHSTSDEAMAQAKKNLITSVIGAALIFAANWIIPVIIEVIYRVSQ